MEKLFEEQEELFKTAEQIENELLKLTGFYFPSPLSLYLKAVDYEITPDDFVKAFNLMFEYQMLRRKIFIINAELEEIKKELERND